MLIPNLPVTRTLFYPSCVLQIQDPHFTAGRCYASYFLTNLTTAITLTLTILYNSWVNIVFVQVTGNSID